MPDSQRQLVKKLTFLLAYGRQYPLLPDEDSLEQMASDAAALGLWAELLALGPEVSDG